MKYKFEFPQFAFLFYKFCHDFFFTSCVLLKILNSPRNIFQFAVLLSTPRLEIGNISASEYIQIILVVEWREANHVAVWRKLKPIKVPEIKHSNLLLINNRNRCEADLEAWLWKCLICPVDWLGKIHFFFGGRGSMSLYSSFFHI